MNYGPLEFAAYLHHKGGSQPESATVRAARAASAAPLPGQGRLTIVSGPRQLQRAARGVQVDAVSVYETIAPSAGGECVDAEHGSVMVRPSLHPVVLVLSSYQPVRWHIEVLPGADLEAVLLAGC